MTGNMENSQKTSKSHHSHRAMTGITNQTSTVWLFVTWSGGLRITIESPGSCSHNAPSRTDEDIKTWRSLWFIKHLTAALQLETHPSLLAHS